MMVDSHVAKLGLVRDRFGVLVKRLLSCILPLFATLTEAAEVIVDNSDPSGVTITGG